jgi:hypothetical protein
MSLRGIGLIRGSWTSLRSGQKSIQHTGAFQNYPTTNPQLPETSLES